MTVGFAAGTPQRCNAKRRPWNDGVAEGGFQRRDPAFTKVSRWRVTFNGLVEITSKDDGAELHAQVADEQLECTAHRPPLGTLVVHVDISNCEIGARLGGRPAELATDHHANHGPRGVPERARDLDRCAREVALKSVLVEEHSAVVLGDHVEVLRQGTVGDETCPFLHADCVPWTIEVACQRTRVRSPRWARVPGEDLQFFSRPPVGLIGTKGRPNRTTRRAFLEFRCWLTIRKKGQK